MDLLARRAHSEKELLQKLGRRYEPHEAREAIEFARENGWLSDPEELAARVAAELGRKHKGYRYVERYLRQKGLPAPARDAEGELDKARALAESKLAHAYPYDYEEQKKLCRWLASRGFDEDVVRRALREPPDATKRNAK
jgi:regulatory protein